MFVYDVHLPGGDKKQLLETYLAKRSVCSSNSQQTQQWVTLLLNAWSTITAKNPPDANTCCPFPPGEKHGALCQSTLSKINKNCDQVNPEDSGSLSLARFYNHPNETVRKKSIEYWIYDYIKKIN